MNILMIMCHKNIDQVIRFAKRCRTENTDILLHCDVYIPQKEYDKVCALAMHDGFYLTDIRMHGVLFDRSLVEIELALLRNAKEIEKAEGKHYQYYLLCSGQDYPIKPIHYIEESLQQSYPCPFIDCTPHGEKNWVYRTFNTNAPLKRYQKWMNLHFKRGIIRKSLRVIELIYLNILAVTQNTTFHKAQKQGISPYGGSQWWILPDIIISEILNQCISNPGLVDMLLDGAGSPDETFFQTMTMLTQWSNLVEINPVDRVSQNSKTWAYFSDEDKPFQGHPYEFTIHEWRKLRDSSCWFARKFDSNVDSAIMDKLDQEILSCK